MILADAGPLIAAFDNSDDRHAECSELLQKSPDELLVPQLVIAEVCYMISRAHFGASAEAMFLRSLPGRVAAQVVLDLAQRGGFGYSRCGAFRDHRRSIEVPGATLP